MNPPPDRVTPWLVALAVLVVVADLAALGWVLIDVTHSLNLGGGD